MNTTHPMRLPAELDVLQARFALRVTARLNEGVQRTPHDISERLRIARERAVECARAQAQTAPRLAPAASVVRLGSTLALRGPGRLHGEEQSSWGFKLASAMPLLALVVGLVVIQQGHDRAQIQAAAEVDTALLADDLPPAAYGDAGFVEYLKDPGQ